MLHVSHEIWVGITTSIHVDICEHAVRFFFVWFRDPRTSVSISVLWSICVDDLRFRISLQPVVSNITCER